MFRAFLIFFVTISALVISAQDADDLHVFTDKKGVKILAKLLSVSEDRRLMSIRREDGQEFETEINILSLDDQQYIKDWMKTAKVASDFRIELDIEKKNGKAERDDGEGVYAFETRLFSFEITVRNLSREALPPTQLEYIVVWDDRLQMRLTDEGNWNHTHLSDDDEDSNNFAKLSGELPLPSLPFNRDKSVATKEYKLDRMYISGETYQEDVPYGIIARVVATDGKVITEKRLGNLELDKMKWAEVSEFEELTKND